MVSIFSIAPRAWLKLANTDAASTSPSKRLDGSQTCLSNGKILGRWSKSSKVGSLSVAQLGSEVKSVWTVNTGVHFEFLMLGPIKVKCSEVKWVS
jgi:hypothetical protein